MAESIINRVPGLSQLNKVTGGASGAILSIALFILGVLLFVSLLWFIFAGISCWVVQIIKENAAIQCAAGATSGLLQFGGILLNISAYLFDFSLQRAILFAGEWLKPEGAFGKSIATVWTLIRDLVNLAFIGGLIWASVSMILRTGQQVGKLIVQILIAALLVNFSYFFAGAILDASHFASRIIYTEAFGIEARDLRASQSNPAEAAGQIWSAGEQITLRIMDATRLNSVYDLEEQASDEAFQENLQEWGILLMIGFIGFILFIVIAWILFTVFSLFTQRFVVIIILLMTAPVGILAFTDIPRAKEYGQGWWAALWSQAIFPPVFLLLFISAVKVLETASAEIVQADATFLGLFSGDSLVTSGVGIAGGGTWAAAFELLTVYIIGVGLMYAAMKISVNIAKQEPLKVPTTGQLYGAYKGVYQGALKSAGALAKFPGVKQLAGAVIAPGRTGDALAPVGRWFSPKARRAFAISQRGIERYYKSLDEAADARTKYGEGSAEHEAALTKSAAIGRNLSEAQNKQMDEEGKLGGKRRKEHVEAQSRVEAGVAGAGYAAGAVPAGAGQAPRTPAETQQLLRAIGQGVAKLNKTETQQYLAGRSIELLDMMREKQNAQALVGELRRQSTRGNNKVAALPQEVLKHENVGPELRTIDVAAIGQRKDLNDDDFAEILVTVNETTYNEYKTSPAAAKRRKAIEAADRLRAQRPAPSSEEGGGEEPPLVADPSRRPNN